MTTLQALRASVLCLMQHRSANHLTVCQRISYKSGLSSHEGVAVYRF